MRRSPEGSSFSATDVAAFLACQHLTALELRVAAGELTRPAQNDIERRMLEKRGLAHEARVLAHYRSLGLEVVTIGARPGQAGLRAAAELTLEAMRGGAELIYQGTLITGAGSGVTWLGRPDFLRKVGGESRLGPHRYEPVDAKLSREPKAQALLQLCAYADQLCELQGVLPERFHVVPGGQEALPVTLPSADYTAYFRSVRRRMQAFADMPPDQAQPYPEPVEHCGVCRYWKRCEERRRADDHLSLVAGITRRQRDRLSLAEVGKLEQLAALEPERQIPGLVSESLSRIREQAALQLRGRREGRALYALLAPEQPGLGLEALPEPTPGDLFLDLEGDAFVLPGGLEYLFGLLEFGEPEFDFTLREAPGPPRYRAFWATNPREEKRAFEQVIDRIVLGRQEFSRLHCFHFGQREADALKKLSCRHATREAELDQLLRDGVLVDLLPIVRHGLRASVESYGLKPLEALYGFQRSTELRDAARAMQLFGLWLETGDEDLPLLELRAAIEAYNRDDCLSAAKLRDFLEGRRLELSALLERPLRRPEPAAPQPSAELTERQKAAAELARRLTEDTQHPHAPARRLLADLLDFHRREEKSGYWEYFRALALPPGDRLEDRSAIAELAYVGVVGKLKQSSVHRYEFPEQEHSLRATHSPIDPDTKKSPGTVIAIGARHVDIKRGPRLSVPHPRALVVGEPIRSKVLESSLRALAEATLLDQPGFEAARAFLLRVPPAPGQGGALAGPAEKPAQALARLAQVLAGSVVAVQGPPGSGKTHQAAQMILGLLRAGKRVGVTANSHAVIKQLLRRVHEQAQDPTLVRGLHVEDDDDEDRSWPFRVEGDKPKARQELESGRANLLGGTAWTWARDDFAGSVDALVIDEAGQMSLANALSVARAARGLVLFGDPAQLEQPQQGVHPPGAEVSALEHWLGGDALTIPPQLGVFLPTTRRLHPRICEFISTAFYEGRLGVEPELGLERQELLLEGALGGAGLRYVPVEHRGNSNQSSEEVSKAVELVERIIAPGSHFRERDGTTRALGPADVLVVAPYNAQVAALRRALHSEVRVGTVDRFQGQEAPVVIYSMTSSSADDAPRGVEFTFSHNRLNVAVSRAQALCVLLASPELTRVACKTPRQMQLVNALCAFLERAIVA